MVNKLLINCDETIQIVYEYPTKRIEVRGFNTKLNNRISERTFVAKFLGVTLDAKISSHK